MPRRPDDSIFALICPSPTVMLRPLVPLLLTLLVVILSACANQKFYVAPLADANQHNLPKKLLLIPPDIRVVEVSAGGVPEKVTEWSKRATENVLSALHARAGSTRDFELVDMPELSETEKRTLEQHVAMYELVADTASDFGVSTDPVWRNKAKGLNYTLGNGLDFLADRTGADAALFLVGGDAVSSGGRRVVLAITTLLFLVPAVPPGFSFLSAGVVDLRTGKLLWLDYDWNVARRDMRQREDAAGLVNDVFQSYPHARRAVEKTR